MSQILEVHKTSISVRGLAAFAHPGGSIQTSSKSRRLEREGQQAHLRIQAKRPETYQSEVSLEYLFETPTIELTIRGRIDGLTPPDESDAVATIEEIKSTHLPVEDVEPRDVHLSQAKLYGAIYSAQTDLDRIRIHMTYVSVETGREEIHEFLFGRKDLWDYFEEVVSRYLAVVESILRWKSRRNESLTGAPFPYETVREGQTAFMDAVTSAIDRQEKLFVRAPTGIGKTAAALFPALKKIADGTSDLVFYLSARTTTQANAEECLERIRQTGGRLRSVTITAKAKICFLGLEICEPEGCPFAEGYYDRLPQALEAVREDGGIGYTRKAVESLAREYTLCPHELSLDLALLSDVVVCDYNYAFDPMVYLRRFFMDGDPDRYVLLIDEAHNLVDRSMDMYTGVIRKRSILDCKKVVDKTDHPALAQAIKRANSYLIDLRKTMKEERITFWLAEDIDSEIEEIAEEILEGFNEYFPALRGEPIPQEASDLYRSAVQFSVIAGLKGDGHRVVAEVRGSGDVVVKLLCIDPSELLRSRTDRCRSSIFFSATLTPFEYFTALLDGGEDLVTLTLDSPFPPENLGVFVDSRISTRYRDRERSLKVLVEYARLFAGKGNCIFFFPSYAYLEMTLDRLAQECPEIEILAQQRGLDDLGRREFLESFVADHPEGVLAFAVLGGIFGEGIDLVGERLVAAVIVGVGLPAIGNERDLMKAYYEERFGKGFSFAYTYPGMNRVLQAAGRVIRSAEDKGTVLFFGQRFGTEGYRKLITPEYSHGRRITSTEPVREFMESNGS